MRLNSRPPPRHRKPSLQCLEPRLALAGGVMVSVVGDDLLITGDGDANGVYVYRAGGNFIEVRGVDHGGSPTSVNGGSAVELLMGAAGKVQIDLAAGDDKLGIGAPDFQDEFADLYDTAFPASTVQDFFPEEMAFPGALEVDLGDGSDVALMKVFAPGGVTIDGGSDVGDDTVLYRDATSPSGSMTDFALALGGGNHIAGVHLGAITGQATLTSGAGNDQLIAVLTSVADLAVDAGDGDNVVRFHTAVLGDGARTTQLSITAGSGNDTIEGLDFGAATFDLHAGNGNNDIDLRGPKIAGHATVLAGSGNDLLDLSDFAGHERYFGVVADFPEFQKTGYVGGMLQVNLGDGVQDVLFNPKAINIGALLRGTPDYFVVGGDVILTGGSGRDEAQVIAAHVLGHLSASLGDGGGHFNLNVAIVGGDVTMTGSSSGEGLHVGAFSIGGDLRINGLGGNDFINVNQAYELSAVVRGRLQVDGGDGGDVVRFNQTGPTAILYVTGGILAYGGAGNDTFLAERVNSPYVVLHGDNDNDTLKIDGLITPFVLLDGGAGLIDEWAIGDTQQTGAVHRVNMEREWTLIYV